MANFSVDDVQNRSIYGTRPELPPASGSVASHGYAAPVLSGDLSSDNSVSGEHMDCKW